MQTETNVVCLVYNTKARITSNMFYTAFPVCLFADLIFKSSTSRIVVAFTWFFF